MEILKYPNEALTRPARRIEAVDEAVRETARRMLETMAEARGYGLAGPQVGYGWRLIAVNPTPGSPDGERVYVNPGIVEREGEAVAEEGCLSLPGVNGKVVRAARVRVEATDLENNPVSLVAEDLLARILQHEIDHLDGTLIIHRFNAVDKAANARVLRALEKAARAGAGSGRR
jgi:peptide deformylase